MGKIRILLLFLFPLCICIQANADEDTHKHYHIIDIDHPLSFEEIKGRYSSYDWLDGNITQELHFNSEYEKDYQNHTLELKDYDLIVTITNTRGKQTQVKDIISLRDFTPPRVEIISDEVTLNQNNKGMEDILLNCFSITDNCTLELHYEWLGLEEINVPGTYSISLIAYDSFDNASEKKTITVHVTSTLHTFIIKDEIEASNKILLSKDEILEEFLKKNLIQEGFLKSEINSNYFASFKTPGIYQATIKLSYPEEITHLYQFKIVNQAVENSNQENKLLLYISLGVISLLSILGMIIYKKRR